MAVAYVDTTTAQAFSGVTPWVVNLPATVAADDVLVLPFARSNTSITLSSTPAGWTLIGPIDDGTDQRLWALWKKADGTEDGTTVSLNFSAAAGNGVAYCSRFSGVDTTTQMDAAAVTGAVGAGTTAASPAITPVTANAMVVTIVSNDGSNTTPWFTADTGNGWTKQTEGREAVDFVNVAVGTKTIVSPASTSHTWTLISDTTAHIAIALRPAAAASTTRRSAMAGFF